LCQKNLATLLVNTFLKIFLNHEMLHSEHKVIQIPGFRRSCESGTITTRTRVPVRRGSWPRAPA
jgi:hypothetical protein